MSKLKEENTDFVFSQMQKICRQHCLEDMTKGQLNVPEKSCLHRCAFKYKQALDFGFELFKYHQFQIEESAQDLIKTQQYQQEQLAKQQKIKNDFMAEIKNLKFFKKANNADNN